MPRIKRGSVGMPKSRKTKVEPAQAKAGDETSSGVGAARDGGCVGRSGHGVLF